MAVAEDTAAAALDATPVRADPASGCARSRGPSRSRSATSLRLLVFVALAAFLLYYVGPRDIAETALKVALAVVLTAALWVGANLLFDQAYDHWTRFNTHHRCRGRASSATSSPRPTGCSAALFDDRVRIFGQGVFDDVTGWRTQPFDVNGLLWGLIGGAALGLVMFLLSAPRQQLARFPLARARVHRASGSSPPTPSTSRRGPRSTGRSCGSASASARWCSG